MSELTEKEFDALRELRTPQHFFRVRKGNELTDKLIGMGLMVVESTGYHLTSKGWDLVGHPVRYEDYQGSGVFCQEFSNEVCPDRQMFEDWLYSKICREEDFEPPIVFACTDFQMGLDAQDILDGAKEVAHGNFCADFEIEWKSGFSELERFVEKWNKKHSVTYWAGGRDSVILDISGLVDRLTKLREENERRKLASAQAEALIVGQLQCNCDLDNWEPEPETGHSWVCRIHKALLAHRKDVGRGKCSQ